MAFTGKVPDKHHAAARWWVPDWTWFVALALLAFAVRTIPGPRTIDDAFITFRYVRNILAGVGFVYNAGERVMGTTTPLYTLVLAGLSALTGFRDFPWLALVVNALCDGLSAVVLYRLGQALSDSPWVGRGVALVFALSPMSVTFAVGGMETSVYILLLSLAFHWYVRNRPGASVVCCALATLTRPDALLAVLPLFGYLTLRRGGRVPWREGGVYLLIMAPWLLFATGYFGSPLTNSIVAKAGAYRLGRYDGLVRLLQHFSVPFFEHRVFEPLGWGPQWRVVGLVLYPTLYLIGAWGLVSREGRAWPLVLYVPCYFAAFSYANPLIFRWYLAPPLPFYFLCILHGVWSVVRDVGQAVGRPRASRVVFALSLLVPLVLELNAYQLRPSTGPQRPAPRMAFVGLEEHYHQVALALRDQVTSDTLIAAGDIGVLGYYTGARILDTVGLISPQTVPYYPLDDPGQYVISYAMSLQLIQDYDPDYVVTPEVYVRRTLLESSWFQTHYRQILRRDTDIYGSRGMLVFGKNGR